MRRIRSIYARLNQMLDAAIDGSFEESDYNETELSKLETKWKRFLVSSKLSQEQLKKEQASIQALVSDISHQTKTPLSNILLYSQLLEEQELDQSGREIAEEIRRQSQKLEFLIQSLVKASRLETGTFQMFPKGQDVLPMLREAVAESEKKAAEREIQITFSEPEAPAYALFDRKWTSEAMCNLLDNSIKYSPPGSKVWISITEYEMFVRLGVHDQGVGIPEEEISQVFQRFYRGSQVREEEGVGLGLYLARQIVEGQGGCLMADSKPGAGTAFFVYLPKIC